MNTQTYPLPQAPPQTRPVFRRSTESRLLLGVCGGLGRSLGISPVLLRVAAVVGCFFSLGAILIAYALVALIVPRDDGRTLLGSIPRDIREGLIGWTLVVIAAIALLKTTSAGILSALYGVAQFDSFLFTVPSKLISLIHGSREILGGFFLSSGWENLSVLFAFIGAAKLVLVVGAIVLVVVLSRSRRNPAEHPQPHVSAQAPTTDLGDRR